MISPTRLVVWCDDWRQRCWLCQVAANSQQPKSSEKWRAYRGSGPRRHSHAGMAPHPYPSGPLRDPASSKPRWEPPGKRGVASHCHHSVARSWTGAGIRAAPDGDRRHKDRGAAAATSPDLRRGVPSPARRREPRTGTWQFKSSRCLTEESPGARPATAEVVTIHHHIPQPLGGRTDLLGTAGRPIQVLRSAPSEAIAAQPTR